MAGKWGKGGSFLGRSEFDYSALNSQGEQDPEVPPFGPHLLLGPFSSSSKRGIQRLHSRDPHGPQRGVEPWDKVLPWIDCRNSVQSCFLPPQLLWTPRKTLPSCHGLCQVATSPWELSQGKEGDQREEKEWERWKPGGIPMGFGGRWAGSMPALGGRLEIILANPSWSGGEPETQTEEGTYPRSRSGKSDGAGLESESWEPVRCLLLSGHFQIALEIPFPDIHLCALCVRACVCPVCACVCTCVYVCLCLCCERVWVCVWPAAPLFGEGN